ncbi:MAG: 4Fe-4S dicluster domain-containing protein, partial [Mogibacterium sp.]|nr:4Fe-4S dicluster domain-containing protein [Mogibacterium sp.]
FWLSELWQKRMEQIEECIDCGACRAACPYELDTPALLRKNLEDYRRVLAGQEVVC